MLGSMLLLVEAHFTPKGVVLMLSDAVATSANLSMRSQELDQYSLWVKKKKRKQSMTIIVLMKRKSHLFKCHACTLNSEVIQES